MDEEIINDIMGEINSLKRKIDLPSDLDVNKIRSEFETIILGRLEYKYTLPSEYKLIKKIQIAMYQSLATVSDDHIEDFVKLSTLVEKARLILSDAYESRKITSSRVRQLKKLVDENKAREFLIPKTA